jgi:protein-L-isoaspartate(D-aspartate) O-methyltransferase
MAKARRAQRPWMEVNARAMWFSQVSPRMARDTCAPPSLALSSPMRTRSPRPLAWLPLVALLLLPPSLAAQTERNWTGLREYMVAEHIEGRGLRDRATLRAMRTVPRHLFVPEALRNQAYDDTPLPIGFGQTISQPYIVAFMTEVAQPKRNSRVLEIGTGSGYQAAVLAELCDEVYTVEIVPELAQRGARALREAGYERVQVRTGDGYHGWPEHAPFDLIVVTAAAEAIPPPLVAQLADGGRMIIPVGPALGSQNLVLVTKRDGRVRTRTLLPVRFVPFVRERS